MPTYAATPEFWVTYARLTREQRQLFRVAVDKFVEDLRRGQGFRAGLGVTGLRGAPGLFEMTWAPDGRGVFGYGGEVIPGETHVIWHAVGTHAVLP